MKYRIAEKFISINGEGNRAGQLAVFIRFQGCNLSCGYCDTWWAQAAEGPYEEMRAEEIKAYILNSGLSLVTLTGGEPLMQLGIGELLEQLTEMGPYRVEIETNGSIPLTPFLPLRQKGLVFTMDFKLGSSGMNHQMDLKNLGLLEQEDTVKFVVGSTQDLKTAKNVIENYQLAQRCGLHFSPVFGKMSLENIVSFLREHRMKEARLQPQLHKYIWHPDTRGV